MSDLHFAHPQFLWALAALPLLAALIFHAEKMRRIALDCLIAARLQPRLAGNVSVARRRAGFALLLAGIVFSLVALARPQWGFTWEEKRQSGRDVIIAIDVSNSMLATDLQPNRLTRAKLAAEDLLNQIEGDRVGLLAFAGSSFLQAPLTSDFGAVRESLQELDTDIIPRGGTNLSDAIKAADEAFGKGESEHRALIIFSDGEELEADAVTAARECKDRFHTFTVGLGSSDGSLIPMPVKGGGTEFLKDDSGQYVKSKLDEPRMREVAEAGGGFYIHLQNGPAEMKQIVGDGLGKMKEHETDARFTRQPIERYQWPLGAAVTAIVASLLLGERRRQGAVGAVKIAAVLLLLVVRADARHAGIEKYEAKDYKGSLGEFDGELKTRDVAELHFDAGSAAYELGDYERAADSFSRALGTATPELKTRASYNLANTLARRGVKHEKKEDKLGDLRDAVQQYDEVLKSDPKHEDAKHNRDLVAKLIAQLEEEQKQEEQKKQDGKKDDKEKKNDKDKKDQQDKQDSSQGGNDKKDDQQKQKDGSGKDQKSEQGKKDGKDQQSKDGKNGEQKDSQEKKDGQQSQQNDGKNDPGAQKKDAQQQNADGKDDKDGDKKQPQPQPKDGGDEKQKSGEVKAANPGQQEPGKDDPAAEAAEAAQAAQEGRMTEKDAAQILEALKRVDRRVRLLDPKAEPQKNPNKPFKNW